MLAGQASINASRVAQLAARFPELRILVIGDLMLDEFIWGKVSRISPEAPVPVVDVSSESYYPGGAANVARNLREFSAQVGVMGLAGDDAAGARLLSLLDDCGIETSGVIRDAQCSTTVKTRIIARHQQVVRVDRERPMSLAGPHLEQALAYLGESIGEADAVIVSDYDKGLLNQPLADTIRRLAIAHRRILTVDPHPRSGLDWTGATAIKPNLAEALAAAGLSHSDALEEAGARLLDRWQTRNLLVTLGEQGMALFRPGAPVYHTPTRAKDVFDVSGAGDTAIAVFTLGLCAGAEPQEAAELANAASGIVVGKLGTATVSLAELAALFQDS